MSATEVSLLGSSGDEARPGSDDRQSVRAGGTEMAVAGVVLSVLWLFFLGSVAGLCLGVAARRQFAVERSEGSLAAAPAWAAKLAVAAVVLGGLGTVVGAGLVALQVLGVVNITAACHPVVTGVSCHLVVHRGVR